ncbi:MAG TPA: EamA family transporter [Gaiella sp.]|jgi:drug/metabolite transporter (DMT)-like permease
MPAAAFALALGSAFLHALWNLLLARERDPEAATGVALAVSVVAFAPVTVVVWDVDSRVWPFVAVTALLQLLYFVLLAAAYRRAELSFVYPIARGLAPVLVLLVGVFALGTGASAAQAAGVCVVGCGVLLVRGLGGRRDLAGGLLGVVIAAVIASYTLVDKHGVEYAAPLVYLELSMALAAAGYLAGGIALGHAARLRAALRPLPALAGIVAFVAYALVLAALTRAPAAPVAAVRETSVVIAAALAAPILHERVGPARLAGAALVVAGIVLLGLD